MRTAIFVLGMHRSGTSLISGLLRVLGVELGPDSDLVPPSHINEKGFFEHVALNGINVEIMNRFGGQWYAPPDLPPGWENGESLADLRKRAEDLIQAHFGRTPLWGFKDPRSCITFPFWRKVVKGRMKVVIVGRNPMDSSRSLQDAQRILASEAAELWFKHMVSAFLSSHGLPRHVVFYADCLEDPQSEIRRLASFVGKPLSPDLLGRAEQFIDRGIRHYASSVHDIQGGYGLPAKTRKAFLTIRAFADVARLGKLEPADESTIEQVLREIQAGG